jgi:hypothetical protein
VEHELELVEDDEEEFRPWFFDVESGIAGRPCGSYADALRDLYGNIDAELESSVESAEDDNEAKAAVSDFETAAQEIELEIAEVDGWNSTRKKPVNDRFEVFHGGRTYFIDTPEALRDELVEDDESEEPTDWDEEEIDDGFNPNPTTSEGDEIVLPNDEPTRFNDSENFVVIINAVHERGERQEEALRELTKRGLWLSDEQKVQAGLV